MRTKIIDDFLNGVSVQKIGISLGISGSSVSSSMKTAIKHVKQNKAVRSDALIYAQIKNDRTARDISKNMEAWRTAMQLYKNALPPSYLQPITTIFKADNYLQAFDITKRQSSTLTAYEGALLMYNTLVAKSKIKN